MPDVIVSLFDESGNMLRPWAEAGFECHVFDIVNTERREGNLHWHKADLMNDFIMIEFIKLLRPKFLTAFPPCTDLAVSGAAHFAKKRARNPAFQDEAVALARVGETIANAVGCPYMIENPVSRLSTMWRKPDFTFHPWEFGGYLPDEDVHPRWPDYIAPRDSYPKRTCLWTGNGFIFPNRKPVPVAQGYSAQHRKLGGRSAKTKQIRSETPRGFAQAVFAANSPQILG